MVSAHLRPMRSQWQGIRKTTHLLSTCQHPPYRGGYANCPAGKVLQLLHVLMSLHRLRQQESHISPSCASHLYAHVLKLDLTIVPLHPEIANVNKTKALGIRFPSADECTCRHTVLVKSSPGPSCPPESCAARCLVPLYQTTPQVWP